MAVALVLVAGCNGNSSSNVVVDPASLCACGGSGDCGRAARNWEHTVNNLMEVSALDFVQPDVGTACDGEDNWVKEWQFLYFNSWQPATGAKFNMAGTLEHFNWSIPGDEDWNMHVIPDPAFAFLIDAVETAHPESRPEHNKCGGPRCMEAEISPDKTLWNNPWFFKPGTHADDADDNGFSWLEGRQLGFYGVWLMDANHGFKSEIHTAGQIWWKDHFENGFGGSGPVDVFWLLFMQDNTGRFDDEDNFDCGGIIGDNIPAGWKPWENSPRAGQWNIAFEVNPATEVVRFDISEIFSRRVVTSADADARRDADEGTTHALVLNDREVVRVTENQPQDDDIGVTFTNLCLQPNGRLRGFVTLKSKIGGNDDKDEEGYQVLTVSRTLRETAPTPPRPPVVALDNVVLGMEEVEGSTAGVPKGFVGAMEFSLEGDSGARAKDLEIAGVEFVAGDRQLALRPEVSSSGRAYVVKDFPLEFGGKVNVKTGSGKVLTAATPSLVFSPAVDARV
jgi:hypothetical protein